MYEPASAVKNLLSLIGNCISAGEIRPAQQQQQQQYFSGDSQDSSKGYTSISVREPLSHIQIGMYNGI